MSTDPSSELRPEFLDDFYAECDEHFSNLRAQLSAVENGLARQSVDPGALEAISRSLHSFKGIAAMVGLQGAEQLAHAAEDYLRQLSRAPELLSAHTLDVMLGTTQRLEQIVSSHRLQKPLPDTADMKESLAALSQGHSPSPGPVTAPAPPASASVSSVPSEADSAAALRQRGLLPWRCTFVPTRELDQRGINIKAVRSRLAAVGEIVSATPDVRSDGTIAFEFLVGFRDHPSDLSAWISDGILLEPIDPAPAAPPETAASSSAGASSSLFIAPSHIVRVDLSRLDELMRITGELVIHRSRLEERINQLGSDQSALKDVSLGLARSLRQLRSAITRVRLVPVSEIFSRMPFVVRDLARETGKRVRLELEGEQTQIDKYLVERLKEPLLHLVRNAFSHGVEMPEERSAAGKADHATIVLSAKPAGDFVLIRIRDDGRGIDPEKIRARAASLGFDVPPQLDDATLLEVLCRPGFSTREVVDRAAGRGVGMSVVRNTVRELGGSLTLEFQRGTGTQFTLRLPLTLSIAETIIVSAAEQICAIPQSFIDEIIQVPGHDVRRIKQSEVIPYRDGVLPLLRLRSLFGAEASARPQLSVLVLSSERGSTGLVVDRVHSQREIVVRPMQDPLVQVPEVSGATELGDGRPVLILDPIALTNRVVRPSAAMLRGTVN